MPEWLAVVLGTLLGAVPVSVVGAILTRRYFEYVYRREFARHIRAAKQRHPEMVPYLDQQTVRMGMGVIDAGQG